MAIPRSQPIHNGTGSARADTLVAGAPPEAWKRLSAGPGSKGQRLHDWAMAALPGHEDRHDASRWLLIRRNLTDPQDLAFFLCAGPDGTTIETLVRIAGTRWAIETCFKDAKGETGLDQYQVRRYHSWYRHITLSMMAYAYLTVTAAADPKAAATWSPSAQQRSAVSWYTWPKPLPARHPGSPGPTTAAGAKPNHATAIIIDNNHYTTKHRCKTRCEQNTNLAKP